MQELILFIAYYPAVKESCQTYILCSSQVIWIPFMNFNSLLKVFIFIHLSIFFIILINYSYLEPVSYYSNNSIIAGSVYVVNYTFDQQHHFPTCLYT